MFNLFDRSKIIAHGASATTLLIVGLASASSAIAQTAAAPMYVYSADGSLMQVASNSSTTPYAYAPSPYVPTPTTHSYSQPTYAQPESAVIAQSSAQLVYGVYGPNTRAVCQTGASGTGYYNCQQLVSYDLYKQTGQNSTNVETVVGDYGVIAAQPQGSFYGASAVHKKNSGASSSYCQSRNLTSAESICVVDAQAGHDGAWAKFHFKRSRD